MGRADSDSAKRDAADAVDSADAAAADVDDEVGAEVADAADSAALRAAARAHGDSGSADPDCGGGTDLDRGDAAVTPWARARTSAASNTSRHTCGSCPRHPRNP